MSTMSFDKRDARTSLKGAFPPVGGAVPRRQSRTMKEAVRRLDKEVDALVEFIGQPFHQTLQEIVERMR